MHVDCRVTITQTGKHQTTLFVLSVSTDPSLHCLLVCLVVKYHVNNESQNLGPSVSRCGEYTALCCNCESTRTSILSVSVLTTSLEISPPPPSALHLSTFPPLSPPLFLSSLPLSLFPLLSLNPPTSSSSFCPHFLLLLSDFLSSSSPSLFLWSGEGEGRDKEREGERRRGMGRKRKLVSWCLASLFKYDLKIVHIPVLTHIHFLKVIHDDKMCIALI